MIADPENRKFLKRIDFFSFLRRFTRKSKNYQYTTVPNGGSRGTHLPLRGRLDTEKNVEINPLNIYSM